MESTKGEGISPTTSRASLGGGRGQESSDSTQQLTAVGLETDAQLEQSSKVGCPRRLEVVPLDWHEVAEPCDESPCTNP